MTAIQNLSDEAFLAFIFCIPRKKYPVTQTHFLTRDFDHPSFPPSFLRFGRPFSRPLARRQTDKRKKEKEGGRGSLAHTARSTTITAQATDGSGRTEEMGGREGGTGGRRHSSKLEDASFLHRLSRGREAGEGGVFTASSFFLSPPSVLYPFANGCCSGLLTLLLRPLPVAVSPPWLMGRKREAFGLRPQPEEREERSFTFFAPSIAAFFFP